MKDTYVNAKLVAKDLLRLVVFSALPWEKIEPRLVTNGVPGPKMTPTRLNTLPSIAIADFRLKEPLELGNSYFFVMPQYGSIPVDVSEATEFDGFDRDYSYEGDDLGANYSKKETTFVLWAPLASKVVVSVKKEGENEFTPYNMYREARGIYRLTLKGNFALAEYHYYVTNSEVTQRTTDPYAKGSTQNGEESVVVDFNKLRVDFHQECLPVMNSPCDAIIYEAHVRDMTIDSHSDIVHKGRFLGLVEPGRKTKAGHPAGLDYLKYLRFTHLQLLPIYDYKTVDEKNPMASYNWGYDPAQYFVPEGSYASVLEDPLSRIKDCKTMVSSLHKEGIRVVMDVVYNHVFDYESSVFEKVVPNYYFRHRASGKMANTSGCGDDLASERPMVRKLILDACKHWIKEYGIDGFRFDLMGILDVETMLQIEKMAKAHDPSFLLYGEGWNMGGEVKVPLATMDHAKDLPGYGFFNDFYRESMKNYLCDDAYASQPFKNALIGSCLDFIVNGRFLSASQSINYVECHDNATLFDTLSSRRSDLPLEDRLRLIKLANATILFSSGIPFLHMGQEIGQSKWGEDNTYNKGDRYNKFSYTLLDERFEMAEYCSKAITFRRKNACLRIYDPRVINESINVIDCGRSLRVTYNNANLIAPRKAFDIFLNPSYESYVVPRDDNYRVLVNEQGVDFSAPLRQGDELSLPARTLLVTVSE